MTEAARYFCDEHLKLLSESQVEKFVCFWCAQNKTAEREAEAATAALEQAARNRPKIICLCGSTRFVQTWIDEYQRLSDEGNIVLTVARMPPRPNLQHEQPELKQKLDGLHFHKIALADEVFILNVGGYVGESTAREIEHAMNLHKTIRWLEQPPP